MKSSKACCKVKVSTDVGSRRRSRISFFLSVVTLFVSTSLFIENAGAQTELKASTASTLEIFRLERVPVAGGAELITIRARLDGIESPTDSEWVPLVTVLRDTLGDLSPENDRLRYVWPLTYTRPTLRQRLSGAVPLLYTRVGNKNSTAKVPPPVLDLGATDRDVWNKIFWTALQSLLLDSYGAPFKAASRTYRHNIGDYRKSHIIRALSVLSLYQAVAGPSAFSESEFAEIQARLRLTDKTFGGLVDDLNLRRYNDEQTTDVRDTRGHNWELLRQRAEAEALVFEPLQMPDGSVTHALLWIAESDFQSNQARRYDNRFLNIANPWSDQRLLNWRGYRETRFLDSENRPVSAETPGARPTQMIPLALYGLDNPKIPMLLVDFRDTRNPKKREMSGRVLQDVTRNILAVSRFGDLHYFLGRTVFDFVTGRRGIDINQPSRLRTYSQLKLLLALNRSLNPELREQIDTRLEKVSLNPLENDLKAEAKLATEQYQALLAYAKQPAGLPLKLERDRRAEMVALEHGRAEQLLFKLANILTFGKYTHREKAEPGMEAKIDLARRLAYHSRFLREVAKSSPHIDVVWDLADVRRSLQFIVDHAVAADAKMATTTADIFLRTQDEETRRYCLETLSRMITPKAKSELLRLSQRKDLDQPGKDLLAFYLKTPRPPTGPLAVSTEKANRGRVDQ